MHFKHVVLLTAVVLAASAEGAFEASNSKVTTPNLPSPDQLPTLVHRHLRADTDTAGDNDEERAFNFPGLEKLTNLFKSKITPNTLTAWAKKEKSSNYAFKKFNLHKAGNNIFDNPELKLWAAYTRVVSQKPEEAMLKTLTAQYGDEALAKMLIAAKDVDKTKGLATDLQRVQLNKWLGEKKTVGEVYKLVGARGTAANSANRGLYKQYIGDYNNAYVLN